MKVKLARKLLLSVMLLLGLWPAHAADRPLLGAEIWIEPGQTTFQIDPWFRELADSHMPVARLFLMWPYLESTPNEWNFTLYDAAFRAAEKYHVHIVALFSGALLRPFRDHFGQSHPSELPGMQRDQILS